MEYTLQDYCNRIREDVKDYDYILIGLGDEALNNNDGNLIDMLNKFGELLDKNNNIFCLEINTLPGMTKTSLIPDLGTLKGYTFDDLVKIMVDTFKK